MSKEDDLINKIDPTKEICGKCNKYRHLSDFGEDPSDYTICNHCIKDMFGGLDG